MTDQTGRPLALIILDGWGVSSKKDGNALALAHTPYYDEVARSFPHTRLSAAANGSNRPEIGHLHLGSGRIAETAVSAVEKALRENEFESNEVLRAAIEKAAANGASVHLIGLLSDAGIDSFPDSAYSLLRMAKKSGVADVCVHGFLDGRDVSPRTADVYVEALEIKMADIGIGRIASLCGRFFAMDEEENLERTARAFTMIVHAEGERVEDGADAIRSSFLRGIADEFIAPIVVAGDGDASGGRVKSGDLVIFFNHRAAGMRQLVKFFASIENHGGTSGTPPFDMVCLTNYGDEFGLPVAFREAPAENRLSQVLSANGIKHFRITDDRRASHIAHGFGGEITAGESITILGVDPAAAETEPELKSFKIADKFMRSLESDPDSVFIVNFPAAATLLETGNLERTIEAVQYIDTCLGGVLEKLLEHDGAAFITASHGGCERMLNGGVTDELPFHIFDGTGERGVGLRSDGSLIDVAPTMLGMLGITVPPEMTGRDLRV